MMNGAAALSIYLLLGTFLLLLGFDDDSCLRAMNVGEPILFII